MATIKVNRKYDVVAPQKQNDAVVPQKEDFSYCVLRAMRMRAVQDAQIDERLLCARTTISGRGAARLEQPVPLGDFNLKLPSGVRRLTPYDRFSPQERFIYYMLRKYRHVPIQFLEDFWSQRKRPIIINIYKQLLFRYKIIYKKDFKRVRSVKIVKPNNPYSVLDVEKDCPEPIREWKCKGRPLSFIQKDYVAIKAAKNKRQRAYRKLLKEVYNKFNVCPVVRVRDNYLLYKLRYRILSFRNRDMPEFRFWLKNKLSLVAQMDTGAQGEQVSPNLTITGNVVNETARAASEGLAAVHSRVPKRFNRMAASESAVNYNEMTDRFLPIKRVQWSDNDTRGKHIVDLVLPLDAVVENSNAANCTLFSSYAYWDGDMEIMLMINANKFQVGQLQMAWYYGQDYEDSFDRRDNVYSASQQAHALVSASTSNQGTIYIPFRYYKPKMGTKVRKDDPGRLNMGRLTVRVLNRLQSASKSCNFCDVTVSIRFINSNFSGMVARDLGSVKVEAQMFKIVRAAMNMLEEINADPERDNPPDVRPAQQIVPQSSHSWSIGNDLVEPTNVLRLSAIGQTPHPAEVVPQYDEMSMHTVKRVFGLVTTIEWKASMASGHMLYHIEGSPILSNSHYQTFKFDESPCYAYTPIQVLSNLFAYWRGTLELRLDVIASPFHSGRIVVAYVPRVMETPTLQQVLSGPHTIFSLDGESRQFNFEIPFIADRPWWPTGGFGKNVLPPSYVYIFVLNSLIPMDNVTNIISVNLYMRGGVDFELSVPVAPRIGLSTYNARVFPPGSAIARTKVGYTPMYIGAWRYVDNNRRNMLRYGNVSDHIVQFENMKSKIVYVADSVKNKFKLMLNDSENWYFVRVDIKDGYEYATVFSDYSKARAYAENPLVTLIDLYTTDSSWFIRSDTKGEATGIIYLQEYSQTPKAMGFEVMQAQMDARREVEYECATMVNDGLATGSGLVTFGERFDNLKVLCRRYQLYTWHYHSDDVSKTGMMQYRVAVLPQGLYHSDSKIQNSDVLNYGREGVIPIVASAYRFYRGGVRFRVVWRGNFDTTIRVEHRPDERMTSWNDIPESGHVRVHNHGYAILMQNTAVNNILEFEIPFYQCGILGLLQKPKLEDNLESYHFSLGNLYFSFHSKGKYNGLIHMEIYYSLADDCRFSVFQGFPPMICAPDYTSVQEDRLEAQMFSFMSKINKVEETVEKVDTLVNKVNDVVDGVVSDTGKLQTSMTKWIIDNVPKEFCSAMLQGVSQLVHCFISPKIQTVAWSIASFLASIGVLVTSMFDKFVMNLRSLLSYLVTGGSSETKQDPSTIEAQGESGHECVTAAMTGTVIASLMAAMNLVMNAPKNVPDFCGQMWSGMCKFALTANALCKFFENNIKWIMNAYRWLHAWAFPNRELTRLISESEEHVGELVKECMILLDAANERKIEQHPVWNMRVYGCAARASAMMIRMSDEAENRKYLPLLNVLRDIVKKRDELTRLHLSPPVRFEPMVISIVGVSNVGKSHICQSLGQHLLRAIRYKTLDEIMYTRTPGNAYWNSLRNQPVCLYDDFLCVGGEYGTQQVAELFCLKSRAVFNPPQADIKDKHIRYNPLIVFLASNQAYPRVPEVADNAAFWRRRDLLIQVVPNAAFYKEKGVDVQTGNPRQFRKEDIQNYEHLLFCYRNDPKDENSGITPFITYTQLVDRLKASFIQYYERESGNYMRAIRDLYDFVPDYQPTASFDDVQMSLTRHADDIRRNLLDIKQEEILLKTGVSGITSMHDKELPLMYNKYKQMFELDQNIAMTIRSSNAIFNEYASNCEQLTASTSVIAQMDTEDDSDDEMLEHYVRQGHKALVNKCGNEDLRFMNHCCHSHFRNNWEYYCYSENGKTHCIFYEPIHNELFVTARPCGSDCSWADERVYKRIMNAWLTECWTARRTKEIVSQSPKYCPPFFLKSTTFDQVHAGDYKSKCKKLMRQLMDACKKSLKCVQDNLWTVMKYTLGFVAFMSSIMIMIGFARDTMWPEDKVIRLVNKSAEHGIEHVVYPNESEMMASGDYKTFGRKQPQVNREVGVRMIAQLAPEVELVMARLIRRNTVFIVGVLDGKEIAGRMLGLVGHWCVAASHYHDQFSKMLGADFFIVGDSFKIAIDYDSLNVLRFKDSGLCVYELPKQFPIFKNLLKHIARKKDHSKVGPSAVVYEMTRDNIIKTHDVYCDRIAMTYVPASNGFNEFYIPDGYKYGYGGRGVCGSVLVSSHLEHPIYGLHVAGDIRGRCGMSEAITYEQFAFLLEKDGATDVIEPNMLLPYNPGFIKPRTDVMVLGVVPSSMAHRETGKSKVIPTECHGEITPVYCEPPVLSQKDPRIAGKEYSPMQEGVDKHGILTSNFPTEYIERAYEHLRDKLLAHVTPVRGQVGKLSREVAVVGDSDVEGFEKLDFNTSEGFPFSSCRESGQKSKSWLFDLELTEKGYTLNGMDEMLTHVMDVKEEQRANGVLPFTVFVDCLKDRKLPAAKATKPGGVRIFSISPIDYTIQCRQYFMDFTVSYQNARFKAEHAIGIDVNSYEWTDLAYKLMSAGQSIVTADYSGYGPSLNLECAYYALKIIIDWYKFNGDDSSYNAQQRHMMIYEIMYSVHLCFSTLYRTFCGLPSGGPLTVVGNSLVGCLYIRIAWMIYFDANLCFVTPCERVTDSLSDFSKHTCLVVYGDDVIMAVSDSVKEDFNCETLVRIFSTFNIKIKNSTKGDTIAKYYDLFDEDATFLKNNFIRHPLRCNVFLAKLDYASVEDTLNYTFKEWENDLRNISMEACEACVRNAYGHGPVYFNQLRNKVLLYWRSKQVFIELPTWEELDKNNFDF